MTEWIPRSGWTDWRPSSWRLLPLVAPAGFAVHYPGTSQLELSSSRKAVANTLRGQLDYHVNTRGWTDIAYQAAVDNAGRIWELRGVGKRSAANGNAWLNTRYGAITCLLGAGQSPSPEMLEAIRWFRQEVWLKRFPRAKRVVGHRDLKSTSCPGNRLYAYVKNGSLLQPPQGMEETPEEDEDDMMFVTRVEGHGYFLCWPTETGIVAQVIPGPYKEAEDDIKAFAGKMGVRTMTASQFTDFAKVVSPDA